MTSFETILASDILSFSTSCSLGFAEVKEVDTEVVIVGDEVDDERRRLQEGARRAPRLVAGL